MKISVLGAGAIGTMLGGLIRDNDPTCEVVLLGRGPHIQTIRDSGRVQLQGPWPDRDVPIIGTDDPADIAGSDMVLVTVKSQATAEAISAAAPYLGSAIVVSVQNGFNDDALLQHVDEKHLVMGITATNVTVPQPGTASLQFNGTIVLGPNAQGTNAASATAATKILEKTGFRVFEEANVEGVRYNKLAINSPGYAASLSQSNFITEAVCHRGWRGAVGKPLADECLQVFDTAGVKLARIPKLPDIRKLRGFFGKLDSPLLGPIVGTGAKLIFNRRPIQFSLYQDLLKGKGTEVDHTLGEIVRLAERNGTTAPYNQMVIDLAREIENRGAGKFFTREEVIDRFRQIESR
ncbi:ketopantoate reductase family protein [Rhodopirellula europaea]|uniref:2-dehydropantoate 2-reductase n=1 Tax=Rhodopirellula europaea 6C TaxID=1263867 RepID=M2B3F5_9BACT|nr:2-dehydropantoate 2-reductase N-terminal domain-containing protein [Rhodopirellula europaea]EMB16293.1 2-dehydropantoate 2-reductase [Rhodopirellula europaea 6C]